MFDDQQQPRQELKVHRPLILIACAGGGILVSLGLCGVAAAVPNNQSSSLGAGLGISGLVVLGLSVIVMIVAVLWLLAVVLMNVFRTNS